MEGTSVSRILPNGTASPFLFRGSTYVYSVYSFKLFRCEEADSLHEWTLTHLRCFLQLAKLAGDNHENPVKLESKFRGRQGVFVSMCSPQTTPREHLLPRMAWQLRPKHHLYHHLARSMRAELYNCRFYHTYRDEGAMQYAKRT